MQFGTLLSLIQNHMLLRDGGSYSGATPGMSDDPKNSLASLRDAASAAVGHVVGVIRQSPLAQSDIWAFVKVAGPTVPDSEGKVRLNEDISALDGSIVAVEVSFAAGAPPTTGYEFAELDGHAAVRRRRTLATPGILKAACYIYAITGERLSTPASGVRISYVPSVFADSDTVGDRYVLPILARALSFLYAQDGSQSGVNAALYFSHQAQYYDALILSGQPNFSPLPPYQGT